MGRGLKKVFSKVQDPVLQVYKSRQGQTSGLEVEKGKTKTKGVSIQKKPTDLQNPSIRLMEPICKAPVSRRLQSPLKLTREAKYHVSDTLDEISKAIDDVLLEVWFISSPTASKLGDRADEGEIQEVIVQDIVSNLTPWDDR